MTTNTTAIPFHVLIAAGGSGQRFSSELPKQYWKINGKTILRHTIEKFLGIDGLKSLRVIIHEDHETLYNDAVKKLNLQHPIIGGNSRKISVYNGLRNISHLKNEDYIFIHDAARPFFEPDDITKMLHALQIHKGVCLSTAVIDTLIDQSTNQYLNRDNYKAIQTPQAFHYGTITAAHEKYKYNNDFTDDTGLVRAYGENVELIQSKSHNFKITTQEDFILAEQILKKNIAVRTGLGFDVHAFDDAETSYVRLGGIDIPHHKKLKGHSDADVVLHAITDAILGAAALGDIGDHFPPSDNNFKNMDSAIFLQKADDILKNKGGEIINIDVTIMCEEPKIGPHKELMRHRVAAILKLDIEQINIKATTTEKLGFTGRGEGIATQAITNIRLPS